jgi:hypothetical protein
MLDQLGSVIETLKSCVAFDAAELDGEAAMEVFGRFAEVERLASAGKVLAAERVAATEAWRRGGWRSAADWSARQSGEDPGRARDRLETAGRLGECPVVAAELRAGLLSEAQAHAIVDAAAVRSDAERRLVEFARSHSLRELRQECRRLKVGDLSAEEESKAVYEGRNLRDWVGRDGAVCGSFRFPGGSGAEFLAILHARKEELAREARREGRREPFEAYAADALLELVTQPREDTPKRSGPKAMVVVHVAYEAITRGALADGEVCEIRGVGPVSLETARAMAADSILRVLVTKGGQPMAVTPGVRTVPRALRILLEARDKACVIVGCDVRAGLQIEHRKGFAQLGPTDLENCGRMCPRHHDMKTYLGFRMVPAGSGGWRLVPPDDYRDPEPADPDIGETVYVNPWTGRPVLGSARGEGRDPATADAQLALVGVVGPAP